MKKKLFVSAAVGAAGLVALTGAALAQTDEADTSETFKDRVAEILGISTDELTDAVQQARQEQRDEALTARLAAAVEAGTITQEESDAITAWVDAKPEVLDETRAMGLDCKFGIVANMDSERLESLLTRLLENEAITEDEAQEIRDWVAAAPTEALEKLGPEAGDGYRGRFHGRAHGGLFGGGHHGGGLFEGRFEIKPYSPSADDAETGDEATTDAVLSVTPA